MVESLKRVVGQLENMTSQRLSISHSLDAIEASAKTCNDLIIINVMRDSFHEVLTEESLYQAA